MEEENHQDPGKHHRYIFPRLGRPKKEKQFHQKNCFPQINHHVVILVHNYSWELYEIGGVYNPWRRKFKMGMPLKITQGKWEFH